MWEIFTYGGSPYGNMESHEVRASNVVFLIYESEYENLVNCVIFHGSVCYDVQGGSTLLDVCENSD